MLGAFSSTPTPAVLGGPTRTAGGLVAHPRGKAALVPYSFKPSDLLFAKSLHELAQEIHQLQVPRASEENKRATSERYLQKNTLKFAILKMINLFLTLFYLILLERTSDPDLLGDPGGKAAQLILNGTHCFPNTCAAHLGRRQPRDGPSVAPCRRFDSARAGKQPLIWPTVHSTCRGALWCRVAGSEWRPPS